MYGKATATAIAAMSRLAEVWDEGKQKRLSAAAIARTRKLRAPFVAKILTTLSQAGLVIGSRGPGGGFMLARPPREILLHDVFRLFERERGPDLCPFGGGICGGDAPCPLHAQLTGVKEAIHRMLHTTTFDEFRAAARRKRSGRE